MHTMIFVWTRPGMSPTCSLLRGSLSFVRRPLKRTVYTDYHGQSLLSALVPLPNTVLQDSSLHPELGILLVQPNHDRAHGRALRLAQALVEAALQGEFGLSFLLVHHRANFKQTVGGADTLFAWRGTTADNNLLVGLLDDFKVVGDHGADLVGACEEILAFPEMAGGLGTLVLVGEVRALGDVS